MEIFNQIYILCAGLISGVIIFQSAIVASSIFTVLPEENAGILLRKKIPLKRFATDEELDVIISMLLNRHNTYMTGAVIAVDGGLSAGL